MGIFEDCVQTPRTSQYPGAKIERILSSLPPKDKESLIAALMEESIPGERISDVLSNRGISVGRTAIKKWRTANIKKVL